MILACISFPLLNTRARIGIYVYVHAHTHTHKRTHTYIRTQAHIIFNVTKCKRLLLFWHQFCIFAALITFYYTYTKTATQISDAINRST